MKTELKHLFCIALGILSISILSQWAGAQEVVNPPADARTVRVNLVVLEQAFMHNRLGASLPNGQMYALRNDIIANNHPYDDFGNDDLSKKIDPSGFEPGEVRLRSYKRPRPVVLRANQGDILEINFQNLLPKDLPATQKSATVQILGLQWLSADNGAAIEPGESHTYRFYAAEEGVFMLMSPNGNVIGPPFATSHNDFGLFGAVNVQPREAEYYRSQVTQVDLKFATLRVNEKFRSPEMKAFQSDEQRSFMEGVQFGLPKGLEIREKKDADAEGEPEALAEEDEGQLYKLRITSEQKEIEPKIAEVKVQADRYVHAKTGQPLIDYTAVYPQNHPRAGLPVLNMLRKLDGDDNAFELVHSDLTALITGPNAGRFPFYLNSPSFRENPVTPDRRQPYREFTIMYHIAPNTQQAFTPFGDSSDPLYNTLQAGIDGFAINYGIAGIGPEIYANRINRGPQGFHKDGADLKFEEFFLSAWAVGDPAILVDVPANTPITDPENPPRATKALYPDDPSNVYHSYMRDHLKFRVLNTGSVAPHVHHQHAHQWVHSPNSDDSHYLDSQMINPGATYTMEMTYNGSGNRNQTVGDSIFHCHFYPHFAQGMWSMWRVHDVFEAGTELDKFGKPKKGARALPDGEIAAGTPIPAIVPVPTIGMAPMPAKVVLSDNGRQADVIPEGKDKEGKPVYKNPGFPFFIPGVAGHRAPHPPLDFAWKEDDNSNPLLVTEETKDPFNKVGEIDYLDGGLPRHLVLDGEIVREFHTRWDFTKDFVAYDEHEKYLKGSLTAIEIPNKGTPVEQAAMEAHATRTHVSYQPNGLPGSFYLNGLPPAPGAPYASPDVDDNGNSNFDARRYKAAVVQTDVVFNKQGWHYPQQRFITLLDDVAATISGDRPPEPFFFRANTGETIEFWHTNLVPAYYELDDFQVRTPTDIIGQHIHLVKFDVTASDGAANGFNYEDGTFSPDEVRDRITAINANGGLYHFNERLAAKGKQSKLKISKYKDDYGDTLGDPPAGQDWNGAQTTVQRFDTDSLLNNEGEDRTLRTVFTHDHFGPSTHQQVGLYGALLVEPSGSKWIDAITGKEFPSDDDGRDDGGPTSWQAMIETNDSVQSYREFAIAVGDLQLAYKPQSESSPSRPNESGTATVWFRYPYYALPQSTAANGVKALPQEGVSLVAIALTTDKKVHVRIFDATGKMVIDKSEDELTQGPALDDLKWAVGQPAFQKAKVIEDALLASGQAQADSKFISEQSKILNAGKMPDAFRAAFTRQGAILSESELKVEGKDAWKVVDSGIDIFDVKSAESHFEIRTDTIAKGWSNPNYAIWAPIDTSVALPTPTIISDPAGNGNIGGWVVNYRNEPLDQRLQGPIDQSPATDPSFAFASIERNLEAFNSQPISGAPIAEGSSFSFPKSPLLPEGDPATGGVGPLDPYTPLLRAYANDKVEVRTVVGAVDSVHSFRIQGNRWFAEPSYTNSGFRDVQGFAISEHFEMVFQLPPADRECDLPFADYLYAPSTSTQGLVKGSWGVLRSYRDPQKDLAQLPDNPAGKGNSTTGFYKPPANAVIRKFEITAALNGTKLQYVVNGGKPADTLVLRVNAGDWVEVTLFNKIPTPLGEGFLSSTASPSRYNSADNAEPYLTSSQAGLHPLLVSYDTTTSSGINVGGNIAKGSQTAESGASKTSLWYAGAIDFKDGKRTLTPIEFGGVNLVPSDPLLQQSFGLFGVLVVEPVGSTWNDADANSVVAKINNADGDLLFTEVVVAGNATGNPLIEAAVTAGTEVRLRVLNSGNAAPGTMTDSTNVITVEGHDWKEEPFQKDSTVIGNDPLSQAMGTQQVTSLESYNLVLPSAGGAHKQPGSYKFFYYPSGNALGVLNVKAP